MPARHRWDVIVQPAVDARVSSPQVPVPTCTASDSSSLLLQSVSVNVGFLPDWFHDFFIFFLKNTSIIKWISQTNIPVPDEVL